MHHLRPTSGKFESAAAACCRRGCSQTSIVASGHKWGLVYPGLGWAMWRSRAHLPDSLMFREGYLGAEQVGQGRRGCLAGSP
jgi:hypothetical protein